MSKINDKVVGPCEKNNVRGEETNKQQNGKHTYW